MFGFTGTWRGQRVSVQGSGMGQPSMAIYATELSASTTCSRSSASARRRPHREGEDPRHRHRLRRLHRLRHEPDPLRGAHYAPVADWRLLSAAASAAGDRDDVHVGLIFSGDSFYPARPELMKRMVEHGVLAIEMEASALYTIAAGHGRRALAICTVSDHIVTGEETTSEERERTFGDMVEIALAAGLGIPG